MANLCKIWGKAAWATAVALLQIATELPMYEQGGAGKL